MSSPGSTGLLKTIVLGSILAVCFAVTFFVYYKPQIKWSPCHSFSDETKRKICADLNSHYVKTINQTSVRNDSRYTSENRQLPETNPQPTPACAENTQPEIKEPPTTVLVWMYPFGFKFDLHSCKSMYNIDGCHLTDDKGLYSKADGVIFHHRDIRSDLSNMPKTPRPAHQKWIWMNMESPSNSNKRVGLDNLFNLTSSYRRDADIQVPYIWLDAVRQNNTFQIPRKEKLVCWVVSNWNPYFKRVKYFNELRNYIQIDAYGLYFKKVISKTDHRKLLPSCKFYLSFENSIHKDYITEKMYNPLRSGAVPVVLGPPRANYEEIVPGNAFIHVDDFPSAKDLAEYLMLLDKNEELYKQYFTWHETFTPKSNEFGQAHACRACEYIRRNKGFKVKSDLNKWYWGS